MIIKKGESWRRGYMTGFDEARKELPRELKAKITQLFNGEGTYCEKDEKFFEAIKKEIMEIISADHPNSEK